MVKRTATRGCAFEKFERGGDYHLQLNLSFLVRLWNCCHQPHNPVSNTRCQFYLFFRISTIVFRSLIIGSTTFVVLEQTGKGEAIRRASPPSSGTGQLPCRLSRTEPKIFIHSEVAGLKQSAKMAG